MRIKKQSYPNTAQGSFYNTFPNGAFICHDEVDNRDGNDKVGEHKRNERCYSINLSPNFVISVFIINFVMADEGTIRSIINFEEY